MTPYKCVSLSHATSSHAHAVMHTLHTINSTRLPHPTVNIRLAHTTVTSHVPPLPCPPPCPTPCPARPSRTSPGDMVCSKHTHIRTGVLLRSWAHRSSRACARARARSITLTCTHTRIDSHDKGSRRAWRARHSRAGEDKSSVKRRTAQT
jgi:hypothetical protein